MRRSLLLAATLSLAGAACTTTQPGAQRAAADPAVPAISLDTLKGLTQQLSSDAFDGRAPTTAGEEKTVRLIADRFEKAGLQPGNQGSWYQNVPLVETLAAPTPLRITGGQQPLSFAYRTDMVANTYQVQPRVALDNSDIVFVGYGINAPERGWNDYAGVDVKGKTVVILINDPDYETQGLKGPFDGRAMTYYGRWTYKYEEAARQGAAAAFIVHDTEPAAYGWNVVQSSWTGAQYNMDASNNHMDQSKVIGWLTNDAAKRLFANSGKDLAAMTAAAKRKGFKAVPLGAKASIAMDNQIKRQASRNVIGILPGKTRPEEYVIYTAHWDHLGRCDAAPDGDDICNGAVDNASGTAGLIALAEAHARAGAADRSIIFLAVTAEESGLLGSRFYGENPIYPLAQTVGGINIDGLNVVGRSRDVVVVGPGKSELEPYLQRAAAYQQRVIVPEPTPEKGFYYRSDHFSLARQGVPMIYFDSGEDLVNGGKAAGAAAAADYTANRYHGPKDEYNPNWDWSGAMEDLRLFYWIGRELAESEAWPNWYPTAEFRAARDRSRAGR
ncbi:M28 family metallopeptidase [Sphingosinicella sp. LY1275]|uniref:M28 family metallopeptidase n=1 Tax=Sphingosinicella sp. LY1275 TaxID=3095379 RepID=UPI002ADEC02A|nr:M28 family metallopeptidase [Sphingosinicella sp. LY1275]MEA1013179.1 M28 family metallopeptidase [Sphingosinicella sp. LY1275]